MNKYFSASHVAAVATLVATLLTPALASAATVSVPANFCTNLSAWNTTVDDRLTAAQATLAMRQQDLTNAVQTRKTTRGQDLTNLRAQEDQDRASIYAQLSAQANTDDQKQALAQFESSIDAAVQARQAGVDAALQAYWQGIDGVLATRQAAVQKTETDFSTSIQNALAAATSSCNAGTGGVAVRTTFGLSVRTAATAFAQDRRGIDTAGAQLKALALTRNLAVAKAVSTFKVTAQAAEVQLKTSFAASASAPSATTQ